MKRLIAAFLTLAAVGIILSGNTASAQSDRMPHENPDMAVEELDEIGILLAYARVFDLASGSEYENTRDTLNDLKNAEIPDTITYVAERYNSIFDNLSRTLENLELLLDEATEQLARNQTGTARQTLQHAEVGIQNATILFKEIEDTTTSLSERLGTFPESIEEQLAGAYSQLEASVLRLSALISEIDSLLQNLNQEYVEIMELAPTELSFHTTQTTLFVGDNTTASGRLLSNGLPLSGKTIFLTLDEVPVATATTGLNGTYTAKIQLPYIYKKNTTLTANYEPSGNDIKKYLAVSSPPLILNTMFHPTRLEVDIPDELYLGIPSTISGRIESPVKSPARTANISLEDTLLVQETVSDEFSIDVTLTEKSRLGSKILKVEVLPQGRYSGDSIKKNVTVSSPTVYLETSAPSVNLLPGTIDVSGTVFHDFGPIAGAEVNIKIGETSVSAATGPDGTFNSEIKANIFPGGTPLASNPFYVSASPTPSILELSPFVQRDIEITISPPAPWKAPGTVTKNILMINPLSISLILLAAGALGVYVYRRSRLRIHRRENLPTDEAIAPLPVFPPPAPVPVFTGIRGRIFSAYRNALAAVERITGIIMPPEVTLREFLRIAPLPSPTSTECFTELTAITEGTLYSPRNPREKTASKAEELAESIKEELQDESA